MPKSLPLLRDEAVKRTICLLVLLARINQRSLVDIADLGQRPRPVDWFSEEQQSNYSS